MSEQTRKDLEKALVAHLKDINDDSPILGDWIIGCTYNAGRPGG